MAKLDIEVYCFDSGDLNTIDSRIAWGGRRTLTLASSIHASCQIPVGSAGEIIEKILHNSSVSQIRVSGVILTQRSVKSNIFQQFKSMQSNLSLKNFNINTIEERNSNTNTLLHWATICGDVDMVKFLLQSGAQEVKNFDKNTARAYAKFFGSEEMKSVFPQWNKIKAEVLSQRTQAFAFAYENKMKANMPLLPIELIKMIGEQIKPSFNTPKPPASLPIDPPH